MLSLTSAMNIFMTNGTVWFADDDGTILCGRIVNITCVKEPPNTNVAHLDHIKTHPAADRMVRWTETKKLTDLYETKAGAKAGYHDLQLRIYKNQLKSVDDLIAFMLTHDMQTDSLTRKAAIEAATRLHVAAKIPEKEKSVS